MRTTWVLMLYYYAFAITGYPTLEACESAAIKAPSHICMEVPYDGQVIGAAGVKK